MDASTEELRAAHDVLSEFYAERLAGALERMPEERAVLGLFCELVLGADIGANVGDIGCGTGRLDPFLAARGLSPRGIDLSPEMIRVARREQPGFEYEVADLRELPFADASLAGLVCWYSLMYLAPSDRPAGLRRARARGHAGRLPGDRVQGRRQQPQARQAHHWPRRRVRYLLAVAGRDGARVNGAGFPTVFWGGNPPEKEGALPGVPDRPQGVMVR